jgi:hypothetical protein
VRNSGHGPHQLPLTPTFKPHRLRDRRHREFVAAQPCVVYGRKPSDAHHLRFAQPRALGKKVDEFTVPLCRDGPAFLIQVKEMARRSVKTAKSQEDST